MERYSSRASDLHIHTAASDSVLFFDDIIRLAEENRINTISITDHDSLKCYRDKNQDIFLEAANRGISLIPGIEMDSEFKGTEVHILGYEIDINDPDLNRYLQQVNRQRLDRIFEQIHKINAHFNREIITEGDIVNPYRDTYMKPHLILELLKKEPFESMRYKEVNQWLSENLRIENTVHKPDSREVVEMIQQAGGSPFLAHPGYFIHYDSLDLDQLIPELLNAGLKGIELYYPYAGPRSEISTETEAEMIRNIREKAERHKLFFSRGSDAHDEERFIEFNRPEQ